MNDKGPLDIQTTSCGQLHDGASGGRPEDSTDDYKSSDGGLLDSSQGQEGKHWGLGEDGDRHGCMFPYFSQQAASDLEEGGSYFAVFFDVMYLDVTKKTETYAYINDWKEGQRLIQVLCRYNSSKIAH